MKTLALLAIVFFTGCAPEKKKEEAPLVFRKYTQAQLDEKIRGLGNEGPITARELKQLLGDMNASQSNK